MSVAITYATHSTTTDNEAGIATGWLPGTLSSRGREQAARLGARYRDAGCTAVYVSGLARAVETATIAFAGSPLPIVQDARLRECDYGERNGTPIAREERIAHVDTPFPGGECYRDVVERVRAFLGDLATRHDGEHVLLIAHAAPRFALDHLLAGVPLAEAVAAEAAWQPGWRYTLPTRGDGDDAH